MDYNSMTDQEITGIKSRHATGKLKECIDNQTEEGLEQARKQLEENPQECMYARDNYTDEDRKILCDGCEEKCEYAQNREPVSEDNTLRKASEEYLKVLSETPYNNTPITNAQTIVRELITFLDNPSKYNPNHIEEPVSEDLGEYINELSKQFPEVSFAKLSRIAVRVAKWQKEQFEKNRLKHCNSITNEQAELEQGFIDQHLDKYNCMPTFLDAIDYGMRLQKQQMMKDAMEGVITFDYYGDGDKTYGCVAHDSFCLEERGLRDCDKVKLIIIKED